MNKSRIAKCAANDTRVAASELQVYCLAVVKQSRTQSPVPLGRGTKGSGIIHCLFSFDWSSYCFEVTNQNKADIMLITLFYFLHNFRTKSDPEAMNTPRKIARQRSSQVLV